MKEKKDCKIIQDLLPNYIEELTGAETNKYIDEHLKECEECKKTLENMQKDFKINVQKRDKREVKYIKKYSSKMRVLKFIILLILMIFIILTGRKMYIISSLSNKAAQNVLNTTNYHRTIYSYSQGYYTKAEVFSLNDKKKIITTTVTDGGSRKVTMYATKSGEEYGVDRYLANVYTETEESKNVEFDKDIGISVDAQNSLYIENNWKLLLYSIPASVKKTTFYGKDCYYITNFNGTMAAMENGMYIDKDTGLMIGIMATEFENIDGTIDRNPTVEYIYEFNSVTEDDFVEPDISEYEIIEEE